GAAFGLMPLFTAVAPLMVVMFMLGLGLGAAQPNVMSLLHERSPEGRVGEALGLRTIVMNSSHIVLPLVFGAFGTVLGTSPAFSLMGAALVGGGWSAHRWTRNEAPRSGR
ncbi:MAG: MFS transporter, partial [Burkholderiaceae bacterium]|nr:MFS transporter [Burkholderiaceae bacterium]